MTAMVETELEAVKCFSAFRLHKLRNQRQEDRNVPLPAAQRRYPRGAKFPISQETSVEHKAES